MQLTFTLLAAFLLGTAADLPDTTSPDRPDGADQPIAVRARPVEPILGTAAYSRTIRRDRCGYVCVRTYSYERCGLRMVRTIRHEHVPTPTFENGTVPQPEPMPAPKE